MKKEAFFLKKQLKIVLRYIGLLVIVCFPVLKWLLSVDVFFLGVRAIYYWNDPLSNAGWLFIYHFLVLVMLIFFVTYYKAKK